MPISKLHSGGTFRENKNWADFEETVRGCVCKQDDDVEKVGRKSRNAFVIFNFNTSNFDENAPFRCS